MTTTRQRITAHLAIRPQSTSQDIARSLRLTPADVRHHLRDLVNNGVATNSGLRSSFSRGRPLKTYSLTSQVQEHNLGLLSSSLMSIFSRKFAKDQMEEILTLIADSMIGDLDTTKESGSRRLYKTVQKLIELHYQARWEAHRGAPRIILGHCPYFSILAEHPELCKMDSILIQRLTGRKSTLLKKQAVDSNGGKYCTFQIED